MELDIDLYRIKPTPLAPHVGRVLIAEPFLYDKWFHRSVVLMVQKGPDGYMGVVLNKISDLTVNDIVTELVFEDDIPLFIGGPMHPDQLYYIHTLGDLIPNSISIGNGLYIDGDFDVLIAYIKSGNRVKGNVKFFVGHSGWGIEQLRDEIKINNWLVANSITKLSLSYRTESLWKEMIRSLDKKHQQWLNYPARATLN